MADAFEANLLHLAVFDARENGMSVRQAAAALSVPRSTVARHWRDGHRCPEVPPLWGSDAAWSEAHAAVWAHDQEELADAWVPYEWNDEGAHRTITAKTRGVVALSQWPGQAPAECAGGVCGRCQSCRARQQSGGAV
ncbi:hypothetical protein K2F54_17880 [Cryobacterium sp. 1639]|nr:hypothetical protein [Cryobacterium sp. 1639]